MDTPAPPDEPDPKATRNERTKLAANYLSPIAGALFTAGVAAPAVAAVFGVTGSFSPVPTLTLAVGVSTFLGASIDAHLLAQRVLKRLRK